MISKTDFINYLSAPMHLWATIHAPSKLLETTPFDLHLMEQGKQIEKLANSFIIERSRDLYDDPDIMVQETFIDGDFKIRADLIICDQKSGLNDLFEIKSGTKVKNEHLYDLAFQVLVLQSNLALRNIYLIHVNRDFLFRKKYIFKQLFTLTDQTEIVAALLDEVSEFRMNALQISLAASIEDVEGCQKPRVCVCPELCHPDLPEYSIYNIPRIGKKSRQLIEAGVRSIKEIPSGYSLSPLQEIHVKSVKENKAQINLSKIHKEFARLDYPLSFLDYESFNPGIPLFDGYHPYEHIVFQYSLHVIDSINDSPHHYQFLDTRKTDPGDRLCKKLKHEIGSEGSVIVWSKNFEVSRNKEMGMRYPQHRNFLFDINNRIFDLMEIFSKGLYVHADFYGRASIKNVLPVLAPHLDYEQLNIKGGQETMLAWRTLFTEQLQHADIERTRTDMLAYCELDTLAMVEIYKVILKLLLKEPEE